MKVVLYARVSTDEQAKKYSIPAQLELLRDFANANNYEIFKEYVDKGESVILSDYFLVSPFSGQHVLLSTIDKETKS